MSVAVAPSTALPSSAVLPYAGTIFLSAFLLFLVQPIIAKQILPWFGGSAAVWTTCLVFFQSVLLAGYAYADATTQLGIRRQMLLHVALLGLSLLSLPILASEAWKPQGDEEPIARILLLLAATIGLPYFLLSTTTPLLQSWYWRRFQSAVPYRLFALSNFASLLALLGFPVLFEPWLSLPQLGWSWSMLYAAFVLVCAGTGWLSLRATLADPRSADAVPAAEQASVAAPPSLATQLSWLALSAMGSMMLLAVTNHVTQNISSVPFLWVLPLSLYLITFILVFDHPRWYRRWLFVSLLVIALPLMAYFIASLDLRLAAPIFFVGMFVACMFCHGELAQLKPEPRYLTRFYLMLSAGGALGAVLVAIVAPLALDGYFELNVALAALALLVLVRAAGVGVDRARADSRVQVLAAGLLAVALVAAAAGQFLSRELDLEFAAAVAAAVALVLVQLHGRERTALVLVLVPTLVFCTRGVTEYARDTRVMQRDFYGVVRTRDREVGGVRYRAMYHGGIVHGGQLLGEKFRDTPSDYFGPTSGYGRLFAALNDMKPAPRKIGVVGLGAGVIAAYGRRGDEMRFYEISPRVIDVEKSEFSFLADTNARTTVALGDGRLSLERERSQGYDVLGIDAFAGDSIPMHLVTREAMALYVKHLAPDGVIVFQATNRYVDLMPVVKRLANEFGMHAMLVSDVPDSTTGMAYWYSSTDQVLVTRYAALFEHAQLKEAATHIADRRDLPTFSDAHHNLFRILK